MPTSISHLDLFGAPAVSLMPTLRARPEPEEEEGPQQVEAFPEICSGPVIKEEHALILRPYQETWCAACEASFAEFDRVLGVAATGAGKTVMFSSMTSKFVEKGRCLILTDQRDLVDQAVEKLYDTTGIIADKEMAEFKAAARAQVVVATVQTMASRLKKYDPAEFAFVVADEADRSISAQWAKVLNYFGNAGAKILGVTATPNRADKKSLMSFFQVLPEKANIGLFDLIRLNYLSPIKVRTVPLEIDLSKVMQTKGPNGKDFDAEQLDEALTPWLDKICDALEEFAKDKKTLIFVPLVKTSKALVERLRLRNIAAAHVDGETPDREVVKRRFKDWSPSNRDGNTQVLVNAMLLNRGYDEPSIEVIVPLRMTQSAALYQQIVGRGTRKHCPEHRGGTCGCPKAKPFVTVFDFLWQFADNMKPMRPANLIAGTEEQAEAITKRLREKGDMDLEQADLDVAKEQEKRMLDRLRSRKKRRGEYFDALEWAVNMANRDLIEFEPMGEADKRKPSESQMQRLVKAGFVPESIQGRTHAEKILAVLDERKAKGLATLKQVEWVRRAVEEFPDNPLFAGITNPEQTSFRDAGMILDHYFKNKSSWRK